MRRAGPKPGVLIAADPATVERSGFTIRESRCFRTVRTRGSGAHWPNRKSHWSGITISRGWTPLLSTNRPPLRDACRLRSSNLAQTSGKARWARSSLWGRGAVSQETCHPQEPRFSLGFAHPGRDTPDASTEVVMALSSRSLNGPFCIAALFRSRGPLVCVFPGAR